MDIEIKCIRRDGADTDRRIDRFGGFHNGKPWGLSIDELIDWILNQGHTFFVDVAGRRVEVVVMRHPVSKRLFVTTEADGFPPNNLLRLPECP